MRRICADRRSGMTMTELAISLAVFAVLSGAVYQVLNRSSDSASSTMNSYHLDDTLRRVLQRIGSELRNSGADATTDYVASHPSGTDTEQSSITFQVRTGFAGSGSDWSSPITFRLSASEGEIAGNDTDDDGDGVVDESCFEREQDGQTVKLADGITQLTFSRASGANTIRVQATAGARVERNKPSISRSLSTTVGLLNQP